MRLVFADTCYWIALVNERDQLHSVALQASKQLMNVHMFTTDEVLIEFLTFYRDKDEFLRTKAVEFVEAVKRNPNVTVVPQTRSSFDAGLRLYRQRPDKQYSMVDCISMETMRQHNITDVLTEDHHFAQEGFNTLLSDENQSE